MSQVPKTAAAACDISHPIPRRSYGHEARPAAFEGIVDPSGPHGV